MNFSSMSFNYLELKLKKKFSAEYICLELRGIMDEINCEKLYRRISNYLKTENKPLGIDIIKMIQIEDDSLKRLIEKLEGFHSKIRLYYSDKMEPKEEFLAELKASFKSISFVEYTAVSFR